MPILAGGIADAGAFGGLDRIQFGTGSATLAASTSVIVTVTFPIAFTTIPKVFISPPITSAGAAIGTFFQITALTATSMNVRYGAPAAASVTASFSWLAIA